MELKQISFANLKGRSEDIELGKATIIHGKNFTCKTTIIDAIKLVLLGFHPSLDKTPRGVFELCSGEGLTGSAAIESRVGSPNDPVERHTIGRQWKRRGESVTKKDFVPMGWPETPVVLLDANDYFGRSDRGKVEMLFAAGQIKQGSMIEITDKLFQIGNEVFELAKTVKGKTAKEFVENALVVV